MSESDVDVSTLTYRAKIAEQAERYEDMVQLMKIVAQQKTTELTVEERNLLSVAYKNVIGARRTSWRLVFALENKELQKSTVLAGQGQPEPRKHQKHAAIAKEYRLQIEQELRDICADVLAVLLDSLIPTAHPGDGELLSKIMKEASNYKDQHATAAQYVSASLQTIAMTALRNAESLIFYFKMVGDYHRYSAEFSVDDPERRQLLADLSFIAYSIATQIAQQHLIPTHPIRLGLALNFSVFHYEILRQQDQACQMAKKAFDDAVAELSLLQDEGYRDSTLIMQLLRDNLTLWTQERASREAVAPDQVDAPASNPAENK